MVNKAFLGLGSNIGNRLNFLRKAVRLVNESLDNKVLKASSIYESTPLGNKIYDNFYNAVLLIETNLSVDELLKFTQLIERLLGRKKTDEIWAPREIDVDILFYNDLIYNREGLKIPHHGILKRDFVFVPLIEIEPDFVHPVLKQKFNQIDFSNVEKNIIKKLDVSLL